VAEQITREYVLSEYIKCRKDPLYFISTYGYITHPVKGKIIFNPYEFQKDLLDMFINNRFSCILKGRQMGISTIVVGYIAWLMLFYQHKDIVFLSIKADVTKDMISRVETLLMNLPTWLKPSRSQGSSWNKMSIKLKETGSKIRATSTTKSVGRSFAASLLILDEAAFIPGIDIIWTSVYPILSTGGDAIVLSTPNGALGWFCDTYTKGEQGLNEFKTMRLPYNLHPDYNEKWATETQKNMTRRQFRQEHCCIFIGSGNNIVDLEKVELIHKPRIKQPIEMKYNSMFWIWEKPIRGIEYIVSSDTARGDGADFSTFSVLKKDPNSKKVIKVASFKGQASSLFFATYLNDVGLEYNNALIVVENNQYGWSVLLELESNLNYPNIYYSMKGHDFNNFVNPNNPIYRRAMLNKEEKMVIGFTTSVKSRPLILDKYAISIEQDEFEFYSERQYKELQGWVWKDGRYDHEQNGHDDIIFADAIGSFCINQIERVDHFKQEGDTIAKQFLALNKKIQEEKIPKANKQYGGKDLYKKITRVPLGRGKMFDLSQLYDLNRFEKTEKDDE
jgi:hypothetical protein